MTDDTAPAGPEAIPSREPSIREPRLFWLLVITNGFVGTMIGTERTLVPLIGEQEFGVGSKFAILSFIATFGIVKAFSNLAAGAWSDRIWRKRVLLAGWAVGLPVPLILMFAPAPHWWLIIAANILLGVNQGLCWSMTVVMKVDLASARRRGFAVGMNEFAGYFAVSASAFATGYLASQFGLRPWPFLIGLGAALAGLAVTALGASETRLGAPSGAQGVRDIRVFWKLSWSDPGVRALNLAGLAKNLNDGVAWGLFPIFFLAVLRDPAAVGLLVSAYPLTWSIGQLVTGPLSDSIGRKSLIVGGMFAQSAALLVLPLTSGLPTWLGLMCLLGAGTAMVYPTLLSAVGDSARQSERGTAMGIYRFWRDSGFAVGALGGGIAADLLGIGPALGIVGAVTALAGLNVLLSFRPVAVPDAQGEAI